ncbi:MAG TPA: GNAT family N-acetyltransferase [Thermomicrobiales bacterium]|nr:GNAT family N-acetyltransferase [Thermomicrobiales bacterium]
MVTIRPIRPDDESFLWDMAWEAAAVSPEMRALGRNATLAVPEIRRYLEAWGRPGDAGVVAVDENNRRLGAAWYRLFSADAKGYGFVAPDIPELSIGVSPAARGRGVGSALLNALLATAHDEGQRGVSLSVDRQMSARRLYERHGFRDVGISNPDDTSITMMVTL